MRLFIFAPCDPIDYPIANFFDLFRARTTAQGTRGRAIFKKMLEENRDELQTYFTEGLAAYIDAILARATRDSRENLHGLIDDCRPFLSEENKAIIAECLKSHTEPVEAPAASAPH